MEKSRCIYCNEIMIYGKQTQIMSSMNKSVKFMQYGWKCPMKEDDCDIIFDEKR